VVEILDAKLIVVIVGIVGACEAFKSIGLRLPTVFISLFFATVCGVLYNSVFCEKAITVESAVMYTIILYGGATLSYEGVLKRYRSYHVNHDINKEKKQ